MTFIFITAAAQATPPARDPQEDPAPSDEDVVVVATRLPRQRGDAPVAVEVIDREEIEASGAQDLADLLETHPGVEVRRTYLGAELRLRGLDPRQVLVLVDGQRVVGRTGGSIDLARIPLESIERIEIVKGPASALYGSDALAGVIHVVTRAGSAPSATVGVRGGLPATGDAAIGMSLPGVRADAGIHLQDAVDLDPADPATDLDGLRQVDGAVSLSRRVADDLRLGATARASLQDASGIDTSDAGAVLDRRTLAEDWAASMTADATPTPRSRWTSALGLSLFRDQFLSDQRGATALDVYEETVERLAQASSQLDAIARHHRLTTGFEAFYESLDTPRLAGGHGDRGRAAAFGQDEWTLGKVRLVPGLRLDGDSWFGAAFAPKLTVRLDPSDELVLRVSAGSGWRAPSFNELLLRFDNATVGYRVIGNPDLRPERSWSTSASADWTLSKRVGAVASTWFDVVEGLIQVGRPLVGLDGIESYTYENVDRARTAGAEAALEYEPGDRSSLGLSATFTDARDLASGERLVGVAPLRSTVNGQLGWSDRGFAVARASVVSARPFETIDAVVTAPAYALLDLRAEQGLGRRLAVSAGVDNLADVGDPDLLPILPRFFYAGIEVRFAQESK